MKGNVMNREIKFRAWDEVNQKTRYWPDKTNMTFWRDGELVYFDHDGGRLILSLSEEMQYTGLKDKNGKDLDWWEGDLLELDGGASGTHVIEWDNNGACFMCGGDELLVNVRDGYKTEKIGNIHEHPDLLE